MKNFWVMYLPTNKRILSSVVVDIYSIFYSLLFCKTITFVLFPQICDNLFIKLFKRVIFFTNIIYKHALCFKIYMSTIVTKVFVLNF